MVQPNLAYHTEQCSPRENTLAYFTEVTMKKDYITLVPNIERHSWVKSYKTFYHRNLQIFVISQNVCKWLAFPA